jgi:type II secretory pathway pseudopilin PulG
MIGKYKRKKSLTLLEILIVMVLIGITAGFAVPGFRQARNNALNRDAEGMLALIRAMQMARDAQGIGFAVCGNTAGLNTPFADTGTCATGGLALDIQVGGTFAYEAHTGGGGFCASATGNGTVWHITHGIWTAVEAACPF